MELFARRVVKSSVRNGHETKLTLQNQRLSDLVKKAYLDNSNGADAVHLTSRWVWETANFQVFPYEFQESIKDIPKAFDSRYPLYLPMLSWSDVSLDHLGWLCYLAPIQPQLVKENSGFFSTISHSICFDMVWDHSDFIKFSSTGNYEKPIYPHFHSAYFAHVKDAFSFDEQLVLDELQTVSPISANLFPEIYCSHNKLPLALKSEIGQMDDCCIIFPDVTLVPSRCILTTAVLQNISKPIALCAAFEDEIDPFFDSFDGNTPYSILLDSIMATLSAAVRSSCYFCSSDWMRLDIPLVNFTSSKQLSQLSPIVLSNSTPATMIVEGAGGWLGMCKGTPTVASNTRTNFAIKSEFELLTVESTKYYKSALRMQLHFTSAQIHLNLDELIIYSENVRERMRSVRAPGNQKFC